MSDSRSQGRGARLWPGRSRGVTMVEILVSIAIIASLAAYATPAIMDALRKGKIATAIGDISFLRVRIVEYEADHRRLPDTLDDLSGPRVMDPWGNPYQYLTAAAKNWNGKSRKDRFIHPLNDFYDLYSMGPDGKSRAPLTAAHSRDDVVMANNGNYIGPAWQF